MWSRSHPLFYSRIQSIRVCIHWNFYVELPCMVHLSLRASSKENYTMCGVIFLAACLQRQIFHAWNFHVKVPMNTYLKGMYSLELLHGTSMRYICPSGQAGRKITPCVEKSSLLLACKDKYSMHGTSTTEVPMNMYPNTPTKTGSTDVLFSLGDYIMFP